MLHGGLVGLQLVVHQILGGGIGLVGQVDEGQLLPHPHPGGLGEPQVHRPHPLGLVRVGEDPQHLPILGGDEVVVGVVAGVVDLGDLSEGDGHGAVQMLTHLDVIQEGQARLEALDHGGAVKAQHFIPRLQVGEFLHHRGGVEGPLRGLHVGDLPQGAEQQDPPREGDTAQHAEQADGDLLDIGALLRSAALRAPEERGLGAEFFGKGAWLLSVENPEFFHSRFLMIWI